jgi:hypothetical protein
MSVGRSSSFKVETNAMPVHDWTRVDAAIFHDFHHGWITELSRALNRRSLPAAYYALVERHAADFGPNALTLQRDYNGNADDLTVTTPVSGGGGVLLAPPKLQPTAETDMAFYRRKQSTIAVRHVSGDDLVAMVEVVSLGNKASRNPLRTFVDKAAALLDKQIHLLILDLFPPGRHDPQGLHGAIWEEIADEEYVAPADKPLTLAAYASGLSVRAYVVPVAVGDVLTDMPLFLEPERAVEVPLEATNQAAFAEVPRRWRRVLEAPSA